MRELRRDLDAAAAASSFSGVVRIDRDRELEFEAAYGLAQRAYGIRNTVETQFAVASGSKGVTALAVVALIEDGVLELSTPARSFLGRDLPLVADEVSVEHLLAHRSGIGDYLDEEDDHDLADYLMPVPIHELATTEQYLPALKGRPAKFRPGERFAYSNSGYVLLALIAERAGGVPFHELVRARVLEPAGMTDSAFLRPDELPARAAVGYVLVDGVWRTNVFHLPVRGSGDGGMYTTAADMCRFWKALFAGRIVSPPWVTEMVRPRSDIPAAARRYGLGFWLAESSEGVALEGCDAGVSFSSVHDPVRHLTCTVISNSTDGAWQIAELLTERLSV